MKVTLDIPDGPITQAFAKAHNYNGEVTLDEFIRGVLLGYVKERSVEGLVATELPTLHEQKRQQVEATPIKVTEAVAVDPIAEGLRA